ncbi:MAG: hypothetical protein WCX90_07960 [Thiohalomonadaceae bacterium]
MQNDWHNFLQQSGARLIDGQVHDFGQAEVEQAAALQGDILVDLSHYGLLRVAGPDSATYMQGQFTNDVRQVDDEHSQLSGYLSAKGRLFNIARLFQREDAYYLRMPAALLQEAQTRLRKYIMMSKVDLSDASNDLLRIGISGSKASAALTEELGQIPQAIDEVSHSKGLTAIRIAGPQPRYEIYGEAEQIKSLWQKLAAIVRPAGAPAWALIDIHAGLPNILPANVEAFVPQMVNLQLVNGVSFRKGCYTGQEVVARMQYLGTLKRRMYLAHIDNATPPVPGTELMSSSSDSGQGAGKVVDAQPGPDGGCDLLVVVQVALIDAGADVHITDANGPKLHFKSLPYDFPADAAETGS